MGDAVLLALAKVCLCRLGNFVKSDDEDNFFRSPGDSGNTIAITVDIYNYAIL